MSFLSYSELTDDTFDDIVVRCIFKNLSSAYGIANHEWLLLSEEGLEDPDSELVIVSSLTKSEHDAVDRNCASILDELAVSAPHVNYDYVKLEWSGHYCYGLMCFDMITVSIPDTNYSLTGQAVFIISVVI